RLEFLLHVDVAAGFEQQHARAGRGKRERGHASGCAGANDDDVIGGGGLSYRDNHSLTLSSSLLLRRPSSSLARSSLVAERLRNVLWMLAPDKLGQELVALVLELLVNTDRARVVAENRALLRVPEELLRDRRRCELVLRGLGQERCLLLGRRCSERLAEL